MNKKKNKNKYGARKCEYQGEVFDSKAEMERYIDLKCKETRGEVYAIRRQVRIEILPSITREETVAGKRKVRRKTVTVVRARHYTADFVYVDNRINMEVVEDVKGYTGNLADYRLRLALLLHTIHDYNSQIGSLWAPLDHPHLLPRIFRECKVKKDGFEATDTPV